MFGSSSCRPEQRRRPAVTHDWTGRRSYRRTTVSVGQRAAVDQLANLQPPHFKVVDRQCPHTPVFHRECADGETSNRDRANRGGRERQCAERQGAHRERATVAHGKLISRGVARRTLNFSKISLANQYVAHGVPPPCFRRWTSNCTDQTMRTERQKTGDSTLNLWRFALITTAVTMTAAVAHLMELPAKRRYESSLWVRLQRTLYPNFGRTAGPAEAAAVVSTSLLARRTRGEQAEAFPLVAVAAGCLSAAHAIFWGVVQPVNVEVAHWPTDLIPQDWETRRDRWEYGHAIRAGAVNGALVALVMSMRQTQSPTKP